MVVKRVFGKLADIIKDRNTVVTHNFMLRNDGVLFNGC
ncbi:hypothetical protein SF2A35B_2976 [Lactiplantibacillus plantarum]|nr:hypothetical protein SF2A35B_2976 [Lactiplantibacillus plantarum]